MARILDTLTRKLRKKITRADMGSIIHLAGWVALVGLAALSIGFFILSRGLPSPAEITRRTVPESTKIYDRTGTILLYEISGGEKRTVVPLAEIPQTLRDATIAVEDESFYTRSGPISIKGVLRAVVKNIVGRDLTGQGGSTITQQLARNAFLTPQKTLTRKLRELILAIQLDRYYTRDKILELYLNEIPYGPTLYGVEAASQAYFAKPAKDLTTAQSAILAALPQAPSRYSPWGSHVDLLMQRQKFVLKRMRDEGKITEDEYRRAVEEEIVFAPQASYGIKAPHFVLAVQDYLLEKYGEDVVRQGGLKVKTTLDWDLQEAGEKAVKEGAERNEKLYNGKNAALLAEDPRTGEILAMVGSRDYFDEHYDGKFNAVTQGLRQPGSALKPFIYLAGFMRGFTPETILFDLPTEFSTNDACPAVPNYENKDTRCFHPQNFSESFAGPVPLRIALPHSLNIPAVKMLYMNRKPALQLMRSFGLETLTDPERYGLSLALGGGAVRLIDLVKAYSVLASDGMLREQALVLEIRDRGNNVLESFEVKESKVGDTQAIRLLNDVLSDERARQGLFQANFYLTVFPNHEVALKTGTSQDSRDAWAMGYTPSLVVGVWAGNNDNSPLGKKGSSVLAAIPIWNPFMKVALEKQPLETFPKPEPYTTEKPILRGELGEIHTILYYVDIDDPAGAPPTNPARDPQFGKWEVSVQNWARSHAPQPNPNTTSTPPMSSSTDPFATSTGQGTGSGTFPFVGQ